MRLNPTKCVFNIDANQTLGFMISCLGIRSNKKNLSYHGFDHFPSHPHLGPNAKKFNNLLAMWWH